MPILNRFGNWCSGKAGSGAYWGTVLANDEIAGQLIKSPGQGGSSNWLDASSVVFQTWPPARVERFTIPNNPSGLLTPNAVNADRLLTSQNNHWVVWTGLEVIDWLGRRFSGSFCDAMGPDGSYCIKRNYQGVGDWYILFPNNTVKQITPIGVEIDQLQNYGSGMITGAVNGEPFALGIRQPEPLYKPFWWLKLVAPNDSKVWQMYQCPQLGLLFHPIGETEGYIIGPPGNYYYPDVLVMDNNIRFIWSLTQGDTLPDVKVRTLSLLDLRISLSQAPSKGKRVMIRAFERPIWQAPFYSFHERYGDTDIEKYKEYGNAISVTGDERNASVRDWELDRLASKNLPLIVDVGSHAPSPNFNNLIVAWFVHGSNQHQLNEIIKRVFNYPEKPIIAYLDGDNWDTDIVYPDNVWPSIQAYRFAPESLNQFILRVENVIKRVSEYQKPMVLTSRFDDFNGMTTVEKILECMPVYERWLREFNFVGHMPFADRRGNGISNNESLFEWARAFNYAIPFGRPNRFDYWKPRESDHLSVLKNKFSQTRNSVVIEPYLREDILRRYL